MPSCLKIDHGAIEASRHGVERSPHWPTVEHAFLADHPVCARCMAHRDDVSIQVHHRFAQHEVVLAGRPDLELDPRNLIALCEHEHEDVRPANDCHLWFGHRESFRSYNPTLIDDLITFAGMTKAEMQGDPRWIVKIADKPKPWDEWTDGEKMAFRVMLDSNYLPDAVLLRRFDLAAPDPNWRP